MAIGINLFNLKGKRALVTGSSQGIGYALAKGLDQAGAEIILNGRDKIKLDKSAKTLDVTKLYSKSLLRFNSLSYSAIFSFNETNSWKLPDSINLSFLYCETSLYKFLISVIFKIPLSKSLIGDVASEDIK